MPNGFEQFASSVGKAIETVPDLYNDGLKPATQESGKTLSLIPRTVNAALVPLRQWIAYREYNMAETEILLAQKLEHVGEEKIVTPEPYVAVPAIQAISYSMNNHELRNLYANLLAKSMNVDTKDSVHPSFVNIINQMSPIDAQVLKGIMERNITPLLHITISEKEPEGLGGGSSTVEENITWMTFTDYSIISISIVNLCRLGLIEIPPLASYTTKAHYDCVKNSQKFQNLVSNIKAHMNLDKNEIGFEERCINKTSLGKSFNQVCMID